MKQPERLKEQKEQMQSWLLQQIYERQQNEQERQNAEDSYQQVVISRDRRAIALENVEEECRRRLNEANAQFNRTLVIYFHFIFTLKQKLNENINTL